MLSLRWMTSAYSVITNCIITNQQHHHHTHWHQMCSSSLEILAFGISGKAKLVVWERNWERILLWGKFHSSSTPQFDSRSSNITSFCYYMVISQQSQGCWQLTKTIVITTQWLHLSCQVFFVISFYKDVRICLIIMNMQRIVWQWMSLIKMDWVFWDLLFRIDTQPLRRMQFRPILQNTTVYLRFQKQRCSGDIF